MKNTTRYRLVNWMVFYAVSALLQLNRGGQCNYLCFFFFFFFKYYTILFKSLAAFPLNYRKNNEQQ